LDMDFITLETKPPGAWMTEFRPQHHGKDGQDVRPHITIVTNFAPPAGDKPALLRPRDVETLLHEFGHALHGLLSRCRYAGTAGTNVRRDFVELPFADERGVRYLRRFSFRGSAPLFGRHACSCRSCGRMAAFIDFRRCLSVYPTVELRLSRYGLAHASRCLRVG
ncbi:MAG: hypothetical protein K2M57_01145, partial [Paramuribaculum sp.]|nr:hypothetical protein [Paramuribaculum sp.]